MTTPPTEPDGQPENPYGPPPTEPTQPSQPSQPSQPTPPPPVNPYGEPATPSTPSTPPPPANPYGAPPAQPAQPAQPAAPQYGQPNYGQQPPAYGQPGAYGAPGFPGGPVSNEPSKAMAITAFVLSFFCCAPVSVVLGIIVLRRGKDGRNHGKGFAIAATIISVIGFLGAVAVGVGVAIFASTYSSVNDLSAGQCINADGLSSNDDSITLIKEVGCSTSHDGQVLATTSLTDAQVQDYKGGSSTLCSDLAASAGYDIDALFNQKLAIVGLTPDLTPVAGDKLVCVTFMKDGSKLTEKVG